MKINNRFNFVCAALLLALFALACSSSDETKQANELVAKANKSILAANESSQKAGKRISEMEEMVGKIANQSDLDKTRDIAKDCKDIFGKARDSFKEASESFSGAGKLKIHEKFKEYAETKAAELGKRSDMMTAGIDEAQAMIDSENPTEYQGKLKPIVERFNKLKGEAEELGKKADKIQADNKDVFAEVK